MERNNPFVARWFVELLAESGAVSGPWTKALGKKKGKEKKKMFVIDWIERMIERHRAARRAACRRRMVDVLRMDRGGVR